MFRIIIQEYSNAGDGKVIDFTAKTEKLYELIGRYTIKYGTPDELFNEEGMHELDFFKPVGGGFYGVLVTFGRIPDGKGKRTEVVNVASKPAAVTPPPPPKPAEPLDERLVALQEAGVIAKVS